MLAAVDRWQRRHPAAAFALAVLRKFGDDRASSHAALIAYYAFFALFPLLLAFVSILGFVLEDDPSLQQEIVDSALARIPVIGAQIGSEVEPLTGSAVGLAVGLAGALWAGLGITVALGRAFDAIWDVPRFEQPGALRARTRGVAMLALLALALIAATVAGGLAAGGGIGPWRAGLGALAGSLVVNALVLLAAFALLGTRPQRLRDLAPGAALAAVGALGLQAAGGWYVSRTIEGATATYGAFALVIGLLSWFWLAAHLLLLAAETNVVLARRLGPRSLTGGLEPADEIVMRGAAAAARRDARQLVTVEFVATQVDNKPVVN